MSKLDAQTIIAQLDERVARTQAEYDASPLGPDGVVKKIALDTALDSRWHVLNWLAINAYEITDGKLGGVAFAHRFGELLAEIQDRATTKSD
jgi:hypothetical protein